MLYGITIINMAFLSDGSIQTVISPVVNTFITPPQSNVCDFRVNDTHDKIKRCSDSIWVISHVWMIPLLNDYRLYHSGTDYSPQLRCLITFQCYIQSLIMTKIFTESQIRWDFSNFNTVSTDTHFWAHHWPLTASFQTRGSRGYSRANFLFYLRGNSELTFFFLTILRGSKVLYL